MFSWIGWFQAAAKFLWEQSLVPALSLGVSRRQRSEGGYLPRSQVPAPITDTCPYHDRHDSTCVWQEWSLLCWP